MARLPIDKRVRKHRHKSRHSGVTNLSSLPAEVLLEIGRCLNLPDIESLSATDRYLHEVFADILQKDQEFARETLRDLTLTSDDYGYHDFLLQILKREINPNYVKRFNCSNACRYVYEDYHEDEEIDVARYIGWTPEDISLVRRAITHSPWLTNLIMPDEIIAKMLEGNEEAVLMLLIPLLKNLTIFIPPDHGYFSLRELPKIFTSMARGQLMAEAKSAKALERLPLRRLYTIYSFRCLTAAEIVQYMCLPSVKRGFFCMADDNIISNNVSEWPVIQDDLHSLQGIPRSRATTVYMGGDLFRDIAEQLFDFFAGPCTIRHIQESLIPDESQTSPFSIRDHESTVAEMLTGTRILPSDPMSYFWDHCVISRERKVDTTGTGPKDRASRLCEDSECRTVNFTLKYRYPQGRARDINEYRSQLRQLGIVPSPQWLALAEWDHGSVPFVGLDDDNFTLEK